MPAQITFTWIYMMIVEQKHTWTKKDPKRTLHTEIAAISSNCLDAKFLNTGSDPPSPPKSFNSRDGQYKDTAVVERKPKAPPKSKNFSLACGTNTSARTAKFEWEVSGF